MQGYLQKKYVPELPSYESDEVDAVCFRVKVKTTTDNRAVHIDPKHSTGRSFEYRELCRYAAEMTRDVCHVSLGNRRRYMSFVRVTRDAIRERLAPCRVLLVWQE